MFSCFKAMGSKAMDKRAAAQAAWREMARGMRKFIAIQVECAVGDGTPRAASLAFIKEQIGVAIAASAGRLCMKGQPLGAHVGRARGTDKHGLRDAAPDRTSHTTTAQGCGRGQEVYQRRHPMMLSTAAFTLPYT